MNGARGEVTNRVREPVDNVLKRMKNLISESHFANLLPDLLNGIHFRCSRWNKAQVDILRDNQRIRFVPGGSVTYEKYFIPEELLRQLLQERIHTVCIAIRHDPE